MKLNLKWVNELLVNEYSKWNKGDIVLLQAQTGTGKTYFIKNTLIPKTNTFEKVLILCNRRYLKQQVKMDLLRKTFEENKIAICEKFNKETIEDLTYEDLEQIRTIDNVTIESYHSIQYKVMNEMYKNSKSVSEYLDEFSYIVCDEAHFLLSDGSFNNKTKLVFDELLNHSYANVKIFISATLEGVATTVKKRYEKCIGERQYNLYEYTTGVDYSYIDYNFIDYKVSNIVNLVKNDKTDEKWIIFVSNIKDGIDIQNKLGDDVSVFIKAGDKSDTVKDIIKNSKFEQKVLISTKVLDNGVNFDDIDLKNIFISAYDRVTFIQMLGRIRVNIENAKQVKLYIPKRNRRSFNTMINKGNEQLEIIKMYHEDRETFNMKYDYNYKELNSCIFYLDSETHEWKINLVGYSEFLRQHAFCLDMSEQIKNDKYAFVRTQLSWLELDFDIDKEMEVKDMEAKDTLYWYLMERVGQRLHKEDKEQLIERIDYRIDGKQKKTLKHLNTALEIEEIPLIIKDKKSGSTRYWIIEEK